ncbi:MAG: hypothetical protein H7343_20220 [Undibacterium sp.]|nr:hypothetical protein [Opitutaceae bacterium]
MRVSGKNKEQGSLVLVALCFTAVIGIALASYLAVCSRSQQFSSREFNNNRVRYLAEVGLEEALWALNSGPPQVWTTSGPASDQTWTLSGTTRSLTLSGYSLGAGGTGQVQMTITNSTGNNPGITSAATVTLSNGETYSKTLSVTQTSTPTQRAPLFANAVAAGTSITFQNGGTVDSYRSSIGAWNSSTNKTYAAVVASNAISPGTAIIDGYAQTNGTSVTPSGAGKIRGISSDTVNPNRIATSAFIPLFTISVPTTTPTAILDAGQTLSVANGFYRRGGNLTLGGSGTLTIAAANVRLDITGDLTMTSGDRIVVNAGCSLQLFIKGNVSMGTTTAGRGWVNNTSVPANFAVFCYSAVVSPVPTFLYTATTGFTGVIYHSHPSALLSFSTNATFNGAILAAYQVNFGSSFTPTVHYDTDLRTAYFPGITTPFIINPDNLTELANQR